MRSSWQNLIAGRSSGGPIAAFDAADQTVRFACELKGFEPSGWIEHKRARRMDRFVQIVVTAARQAEADAGLEIARESDRVGVSIGTGMGGLKSLAGVCETLVERGPDRVNPFSIPGLIPNMAAACPNCSGGSSACGRCAGTGRVIDHAALEWRLPETREERDANDA